MSGEETESDGDAALRDVENREAARRPAGARGPKNETLPHWHDPKAVHDITGDRWLFKCKHLHGRL